LTVLTGGGFTALALGLDADPLEVRTVGRLALLPDPVLRTVGRLALLPDPVLRTVGRLALLPDPVLRPVGRVALLPDPVLRTVGRVAPLPDPVLRTVGRVVVTLPDPVNGIGFRDAAPLPVVPPPPPPGLMTRVEGRVGGVAVGGEAAPLPVDPPEVGRLSRTGRPAVPVVGGRTAPEAPAFGFAPVPRRITVDPVAGGSVIGRV